MGRTLALIALLLLGACSTVQTSGLAAPAARDLAQERIQLRVRTGNDQMDRLVYEMVYQQFADVIPLREREPYTGYFEITFASTTAGSFIGTSNASVNVNASGSGWYTGDSGAIIGRANGSSSAITTGTFLEWQNSTMLAVLKHADGERLWSADYSYKGGWEMSGWVVNTPEEAARLVSKRLKARFISDRNGATKP